MDDEPMWAADHVVAPTLGSAITIPELPTNSLLRLDWAKNQKTKSSLKKTVAFADEGSSNSDTNKIMARIDAMTMKLDAQYKEFQFRSKQPNSDHNDDDTPIFADKQSTRPSGSLPSNTQPNPKGSSSKPYQPPQAQNEHVNVVLTRSGKSYNPPTNPNDQQNDSENPVNFDSNDEDEEPKPQPKYGKFLDMIRAVRINAPLVDVLAGMPNYGKFLKELFDHGAFNIDEAPVSTPRLPFRCISDFGGVTDWYQSQGKIVEKRVAKAIEKYEKTRADSNNAGGSGSTNTRGTVVPEMHGCSYKTFMNGKPHSFKGTEGVVGLKRWIEKMEQVSPVIWTEVGESQLIGPELVQETTEKIFQIKERLITARSRQKSYADKRRKPLEFEVGDRVLLKVSPWKGVVRFGKKGKLAPRYVGPFEIVERVGPVAYRLKLPQELSCVHDTFHVSNLKKCLAEPDVQVPLDEIAIDENLGDCHRTIEIEEQDCDESFKAKS
ncbi:hypothetical protein Tco_0304207 [Tanacetum coccineum]